MRYTYITNLVSIWLFIPKWSSGNQIFSNFEV